MDQQLTPDADQRVGFDPAKRGPVIDIAFAEFNRFPSCPICLCVNPSTREHVPPRALGGRVMTFTCRPCNHQLGASFESALADWFHERVGFAVAGPDERYRVGGKVLVRRDSGGAPRFEFEGAIKKHIVELIEEDGALLRPFLPSERAVKVAILKSSYLAATLLLGGIQMSEQAERVRALLVAARDDPLAQAWPHEHLLREVRFSQTYSRPTGSVTLALHRETSGEVSVAVGLAGTVYSRFPLDAGMTWKSKNKDGIEADVALADVFDGINEDPSLWSGVSLGMGRFGFQRQRYK